MAILDFQIPEFLTANNIQRAVMHHHTKFCQNRSSCHGDTAIFPFLNSGNLNSWQCWEGRDALPFSKSIKWLLRYHDFSIFQATILDFQILLILMADELQRSQMHHYAKFHRNQSSGCRDTAIFPFCRMVASGHLDFNFWNLNGLYRLGVPVHHRTKVHQNR